MEKYQLKMNPLKCAFSIRVGNFLGLLINKKGIEVDKNKAKGILELSPPTSKKQLQMIIGKVHILRRFITN